MATTTIVRPLAGVAAATVCVLLVVAIAMQFSPTLSWGPVDFAMAGALLFGVGSASVFVLRRVLYKGYRWLAVAGTVACAALIWAELAVGVFR